MSNIFGLAPKRSGVVFSQSPKPLNPRETAPPRLAVRINELLLALLETFLQQKIPLRKTLTGTERTVRLFLQELPTKLNGPWTLELMAESCHLGVTQFVRHFSSLTNLTPAKFLNQARLQTACKLLVEKPFLSITEIGFQCGFSSSQYFTNAFKMQMHCSPREYRAAALEIN